MFDFIVEYIKKPTQIGTFLPCFGGLVDSVISNIDFSNDLTILEFGPGNGNFTKKILRKATQKSCLYSFEINEKFYENCQNIEDERLVLVNDSAENISKYIDKKVDVIISGVPLSALDKKLRMKIIENSYNFLRKDGKFIQYQYFSSAYSDLKLFFPSIQKYRVYFHLPPAIYYFGQK
ncbi:class I SAM-dependent methyltransferase [Candidatus Absconditicoccus praedator]|uniref:class I SAM-dependent methyltransferase n=1 Tax=Candidatus Absconditicoccus praedator TaxID=2735562 RepID=UPI001E3D53B9|nr:methyltransferase domain-containing protein [Candidatus Absconditicoccus praedator]UFX82673.1 methyltransferase domain-containing protein [Candidatus Absconditicoccus praedator]